MDPSPNRSRDMQKLANIFNVSIEHDFVFLARRSWIRRTETQAPLVRSHHGSATQDNVVSHDCSGMGDFHELAFFRKSVGYSIVNWWAH